MWRHMAGKGMPSDGGCAWLPGLCSIQMHLCTGKIRERWQGCICVAWTPTHKRCQAWAASLHFRHGIGLAMQAVRHMAKAVENISECAAAWHSVVTPHAVLPQEMLRKRRYGRLRKAMGDVALLAGSPADANDHFSTAVELSRPAQDWVWCAAALEGKAHALVSSREP